MTGMTVSKLKAVALIEAAKLPPGVFGEYREAINSCDTVEAATLAHSRSNSKERRKKYGHIK